MWRKWLAFLMACVMLAGVSAVALADVVIEAPSKTADNTVIVNELSTTDENGDTVVLSETDIVIVAEQQSEKTLEVLDEIYTAVTEEGKAPGEFFASTGFIAADVDVVPASTDKLQERINAVLPEGKTVDLNKMEMNEFFGLEVQKFSDVVTGDVEVTLSVVSEYSEDETIVAVVGIYDYDADGKLVPTWYVYPVTVVANKTEDTNSDVKILFDQEILLEMREAYADGRNVVVALLSEVEASAL